MMQEKLREAQHWSNTSGDDDVQSPSSFVSGYEKLDGRLLTAGAFII